TSSSPSPCRKEIPAVGGAWTQERVDAIAPDIHDRPVGLVEACGGRLSAADLTEALGSVLAVHAPKRARRPRGSQKKSPDTPRRSYAHACGCTGHPSDQVCLALPVSRILREQSRFSWAGEDPVPDGPDSDGVKLIWSDNPEGTGSAELIFRPDTKAE